MPLDSTIRVRAFALVLAAVPLLASIGACDSGSEEPEFRPVFQGEPVPATGLGVEEETVVAEGNVLLRATNVGFAGDIVALWAKRGTPFQPPALYVTSVDSALGDDVPLRALDVSPGVSHLGVDEEYVAWMDQPTPDYVPPRIRVFETIGLEDPASVPVEWSPYPSDELRMTCMGLAGSWLAFVGRSDDALTGPQRVGIADLSDDFGDDPIDLGEYEVNRGACALSERAFVWVGDRMLYALEAPFGATEPIEVASVGSGITADLRIEGGLVTYFSGTDLRVFDLDRPLVADENPRSVGRYLRLGQTERHVLYANTLGSLARVLDGKAADTEPRSIYAADEPQEMKPILGGRFVLYSVCSKVRRSRFGQPDCADGRDGEPSGGVAVRVLDLDDPDGESISLGVAFYAQDGAASLLGAVWLSDGALMYWNPSAPIVKDVNPLRVVIGGRRGPGRLLGTNGLLWWDIYGDVVENARSRRIRFLDAMRLLLATRDDS